MPPPAAALGAAGCDLARDSTSGSPERTSALAIIHLESRDSLDPAKFCHGQISRGLRDVKRADTTLAYWVCGDVEPLPEFNCRGPVQNVP